MSLSTAALLAPKTIEKAISQLDLPGTSLQTLFGWGLGGTNVARQAGRVPRQPGVRGLLAPERDADQGADHDHHGRMQPSLDGRDHRDHIRYRARWVRRNHRHR